MIGATRTPEGARGKHTGPPAVRYDVQAAWPGIDARDPRDWCHLCTRAMHGGVYQVKFRDVACLSHHRASHG